MNQYTSKVAALNDLLRTNFIGGRVLKTRGFHQLPEDKQSAVLSAVRSFTDFNKDNDPYGEHDFGQFVVNGLSIMWKIDYYDTDLKYHSPDPSNPNVTVRVLTIMLADEY